MSDQNTIFSQEPDMTNAGEDQTNEGNKQQSDQSENSNYLSQYVGEDKKYKTVEDLAKAVYHKDQHIETLESENKVFKSQTDKAEELRQLVQELKENSREDQVPTSTAGLSEKDVEALLDKRSEREKIANNLQTIDFEMQQRFGDSAKQVLVNRARELGVSTEYMANLAGTQPGVFRSLFKETANTSQTAATTSTTSIPNTTPTQESTLSEMMKDKRTSGRRTKELTQQEREQLYARIEAGEDPAKVLGT